MKFYPEGYRPSECYQGLVAAFKAKHGHSDTSWPGHTLGLGALQRRSEVA